MSVEKRNRRRLPMIAIVVMGLLLGFVVLIAANRRNVKAGLNTPIRFDDFDFQVKNVQITPGISKGLVSYTITLQVDNRAKRVPFTFDERRVVVRDNAERSFRTVPPAAAPSVLPAGTNASFDLRFDLPVDIGAPRMRVLASGPVGDMLEFLLFGDKEFSLPEPSESGPLPDPHSVREAQGGSEAFLGKRSAPGMGFAAGSVGGPSREMKAKRSAIS